MTPTALSPLRGSDGNPAPDPSLDVVPAEPVAAMAVDGQLIAFRDGPLAPPTVAGVLEVRAFDAQERLVAHIAVDAGDLGSFIGLVAPDGSSIQASSPVSRPTSAVSTTRMLLACGTPLRVVRALSQDGRHRRASVVVCACPYPQDSGLTSRLLLAPSRLFRDGKLRARGGASPDGGV